jgi:predicted alpha/beta hydrolase family esterase
MSQVIILHGATSRPERAWFPWLTWKLSALGHDVFVPRLPQSKTPNKKLWIEAYQKQVPQKLHNQILIGHSTGANLALHLLQVMNFSNTKLFLVSPFYRPLKNNDFNQLLASFINSDFDFSKIKNSCHQIQIFHGDNDDVIPIEQALEISQKLDCNLNVISNGRHLNTSAGWFEFPDLLNAINASI